MKKIPALLAAAVSALVLTSCSSTAGNPTTATSTTLTVPSRGTADPSATPVSSADDVSLVPVGTGTPITPTAGDSVITAMLNDSQVSKDFIRTLPTTLPWFRNAGIEYITELPAPMTETGPFYTDVAPGDLVYYNPRDSITIIYAANSSVPTLTLMGEITSDLEAFENLPDDVDMTVALD